MQLFSCYYRFSLISDYIWLLCLLLIGLLIFIKQLTITSISTPFSQYKNYDQRTNKLSFLYIKSQQFQGRDSTGINNFHPFIHQHPHNKAYIVVTCTFEICRNIRVGWISVFFHWSVVIFLFLSSFRNLLIESKKCIEGKRRRLKFKQTSHTSWITLYL